MIRWDASDSRTSPDDILTSGVVVSTIEPANRSFAFELVSDLNQLVIRKASVEDSERLFGSEFVQRRHHFDVGLPESLATGDRTGRLFCRLPDGTSAGPQGEIPVKVVVGSAITSQPSSLFAVLEPSGPLPSWTLVIDKSRMKDPALPIEISSNQDWLTVSELSPQSAVATDHKVIVSVSVSKAPNENTGTINIRNGRNTLLVVPVTIQDSHNK